MAVAVPANPLTRSALVVAFRRARRRRKRWTVKVLLQRETYARLVLSATLCPYEVDAPLDAAERLAENVGSILERALYWSYKHECLPPLVADLRLVEISLEREQALRLLEEAGKSAHRTRIRDPKVLAQAQWRHTGHRLEAAYLAWEREQALKNAIVDAL